MSTFMPSSAALSSALRRSGLVAAAAAATALAAIGIPLAIAAPTAVPPSDTQGYVDSTARCTKPDTAVMFGTTDTSRVAICKTAAGAFEYRGVRVRDGAKLIATATQTSDSTYIVKNDGVTYTVTPTALSVTAGGSTFRTESWLDYHGAQAPASVTTSSKPSTSGSTSASTSAAPTTSSSPTTSSAPSSSAPSTSASASASTQATASATPGLTTSAPKTSAAPLPPLPAEVGGSGKTG